MLRNPASSGSNQAGALSKSATAPASTRSVPNNPNIWNDDLSKFCELVDTYRPTVPDEVVEHILSVSGVAVKDPRINRLVALAADKFLAEIVYEAKQLSLLRKKNYSGKSKRKIEELTDTFNMEDLSTIL